MVSRVGSLARWAFEGWDSTTDVGCRLVLVDVTVRAAYETYLRSLVFEV